MKETHKKPRKKSGFFRQIFFSFFLTTAVLAILVTLFITVIYNKAIKNTVYHFNQKLLAQSDYSVEYVDELAQRLTDALHQDRDVIAFLYSDTYDSKEMIYLNQAVQKKIFSLPYVDSVYLYNGAQDLFYSSKTGEQTTSSKFYNQSLVEALNHPEEIKEMQGRPFAHNTHSTTDSPNVCSYLLPVWNPSDDSLRSILVINIKIESLINTIQSINQVDDDFDTQFLVINQKGQVLGTPPSMENPLTEALLEFPEPNNVLLASDIRERIHGQDNSYFSYSMEGKKYLVMYNDLNQNDWTLVGIYSERDLFQEVRKVSYVSIVMLSLLFFACILFGLANARRISQPIESISQRIKKSFALSSAKNPEEMSEIELIHSVFSSMEEQNQQFETLQQESSHAMQQELLSGLVGGTNLYTIDKLRQRLDFLNLSFVYQQPLRLIVFQIDEYQTFENSYNPRERWAYRFAITNLISEITEDNVQNVVFSQDYDKFVMLLNENSLPSGANDTALQELLSMIQEHIKEHLRLSVTIAYSQTIHEIAHVANEYEILLDLLQLRIKVGYGQLLSTALLEDMEYGSFEIPTQTEAALFHAINSNDVKTATLRLEELFQTLRPYAYNEIMYYINHLAYATNEDVVSKNMDLRADIHEAFQELLSSISSVETLEQIQLKFLNYITQLCQIVSQKQETKNNEQIITGRILEIIEEQYTDSNLSLVTIATQLDLSPKYVGRVFRETTNTSVARYLLEFRLDLVGEAIQNQKYDAPTTQESVGLEFNNYFYTCFKNHFGMTLSDYRAQYPETDVL